MTLERTRPFGVGHWLHQPGRLAASIAIDTPRPRRRDDPANRDLIARLRGILGDDASA